MPILWLADDNSTKRNWWPLLGCVVTVGGTLILIHCIAATCRLILRILR